MELMALDDIFVRAFRYKEEDRARLKRRFKRRVKAAAKRYANGEQLEPLQVVETHLGWTLIDGFTRYRALRSLGVTEYYVIKRYGDPYELIGEVLRLKREKQAAEEALQEARQQAKAKKKRRRAGRIAARRNKRAAREALG